MLPGLKASYLNKIRSIRFIIGNILLIKLFQENEMANTKVDEKTQLHKYLNKEKEEKSEESNDEGEDINDALENAGCGLGTFLYTVGTFLFCCLQGSENVILAIVGPVLKCDWNLGPLSLSLLQISTMFAMICFSGLTSPLGDKFGRRPMALIGAVGVTITGILCAFTKAYWQLLVLRLVMGVFFGLGTPPALVFSGEIPPKRFRALALSGFSLAWGVGVSISGAIAYFVMEPYGWQGLVLSIPIAFSPCIIFLASIRNSPRFDYYSGNAEKAEKTIEQLYKLNGKGEVKIKLKELDVPTSGQDAGIRTTYTILQNTDNIKNTVFIILMGFSSCFCYYVFAYIMPRLLNEGYCTGQSVEIKDSCSFDKKTLLNIEIINISEPVGLIITLLLLEFIGRRKAFMGAAVLTFLLPSALYFCAGYGYLLIFLLLIYASIAGFALAPMVLVGEYMPTVIRSYMTSLEAVSGWFGNIVGILVAEFAYNYSPKVAIGILQGAACIAVFCLAMLKRETGGENLT